MNYSNYMAYTIYDAQMEKEYDSILSHQRTFMLKGLDGDNDSEGIDVSVVFYRLIDKMLGISSPQRILKLAEEFELSIQPNEENERFRNEVYGIYSDFIKEGIDKPADNFIVKAFGEMKGIETIGDAMEHFASQAQQEKQKKRWQRK